VFKAVFKELERVFNNKILNTFKHFIIIQTGYLVQLCW